MAGWLHTHTHRSVNVKQFVYSWKESNLLTLEGTIDLLRVELFKRYADVAY